MRILILAPHTDDGEIGAGGSIAKFSREGHDVHYVAFSAAEKSVPPDFPPDVLRTEVVNATQILGIPSSNLRVLNFEVRGFPSRRQDILEVMVSLQRKLSPDIVLLPNTHDSHQDHQTVASEGFRAFKYCTILGYEIPTNSVSFTSTAFVLLSDEELEMKLEALKKYKSQLHRPTVEPGFITSLARVRGGQVGAKYAEAFEVIRWIMK